MTPWTTAYQAYLSFTISPRACSNSHLLNRWCYLTIHSLLPASSFALNHFQHIRVFSNDLALHNRWSMYSSYSFSIDPSNKYSESISFRTDWFDLLAVQGTLKSLLQHYSSKASIFWHRAFFIVQLPHSYMTTGKTIALTRWTFVSKVISLLFNMLSRFVIAFLSRSKRLLQWVEWDQLQKTIHLWGLYSTGRTLTEYKGNLCRIQRENGVTGHM